MSGAGGRREPQTRAKRQAAPLQSVHYIDLCSGLSQVVLTEELRFAERQFCLAHWWNAAQGRFAPVPQLRHAVLLTGFTMRGQVVASSARAVKTVRGGALLQIRDPRGVLVSSVAFARRAREGAWLWRQLVEGAQSPQRPMEYPREPWIVRRLEPGAGRNAALLGQLAFVEFAVGVAWLGQVMPEGA